MPARTTESSTLRGGHDATRAAAERADAFRASIGRAARQFDVDVGDSPEVETESGSEPSVTELDVRPVAAITEAPGPRTAMAEWREESVRERPWGDTSSTAGSATAEAVSLSGDGLVDGHKTSDNAAKFVAATAVADLTRRLWAYEAANGSTCRWLLELPSDTGQPRRFVLERSEDGWRVEPDTDADAAGGASPDNAELSVNELQHLCTALERRLALHRSMPGNRNSTGRSA